MLMEIYHAVRELSEPDEDLAPTTGENGLCEAAKGGENGLCEEMRDDPGVPFGTFATSPALPLILPNVIGCVTLEPLGVAL